MNSIKFKCKRCRKPSHIRVRRHWYRQPDRLVAIGQTEAKVGTNGRWIIESFVCERCSNPIYDEVRTYKALYAWLKDNEMLGKEQKNG